MNIKIADLFKNLISTDETKSKVAQDILKELFERVGQRLFDATVKGDA